MTTPFTVIVPVKVTDANLISTNVPETDYPAYNAGTSYSLGTRVIVSHMVYQSLSASNTGNYPPSTATHWVLVGPTNAWAAFDESGGTLTTAGSTLEFSVSGDLATAIGLLEVNASNVRLRAWHPVEGTYYDKNYVLQDRAVVANWFDYFYTPIDRQSELIVTDIPPIAGSQYTVTMTAPVNAVLGTFVLGASTAFGFTQYNAQSGIIDYSRKEVNEFGRASLEQRPFSDRMTVSIWMPSGIVDSVKRKLSSLRAKPCLWIAAQGQYECLTVFGFYRDFSIDVAYPNQSICSAEFEGLS